jgi:hypothetical protein
MTGHILLSETPYLDVLLCQSVVNASITQLL